MDTPLPTLLHSRRTASASFLAEEIKQSVSGMQRPVTGEVLVGPLEGHTSLVKSMFWQKGKLIVSGSDDRTIEDIDILSSRPRCVAISLDGKCIVSGGIGVNVWDAETGEALLGPLHGHADIVKSVAFSQDGKRIVSGSFDQTIRIWDAETGEVLLGPLEGHTSTVMCVAFSQDGKRIVSGSEDGTICIRDAETREYVAEPSEGHSSVESGDFISVSGSNDHTCNWYVFHNDPLTEFTDSSMLNDGWILNLHLKPLFWVPPWNRVGLCRPGTSFVIGRGVLSTKLDLDNFVHGDSWVQCNAQD